MKNFEQNATYKKLREKLLSTALSSNEFKDELKSASKEITSAAQSAINEATIEGIFENVLYSVLREIGVRFHPQKEAIVHTRRHTAKGRTDSRIGAVVIEYKQKSKLKSINDVLKANKQLEEYICAITQENENLVVGFLTDGLCLFETRSAFGRIVSRSGKLKINENNLLLLIRCIVSLNQSALTSHNLIRDFCGDSYLGVLYAVARILNSILIRKSTPKTDMLRTEWEELFRLSHDDRSQQKRIQDRRQILSEIFNENLGNASAEY